MDQRACQSVIGRLVIPTVHWRKCRLRDVFLYLKLELYLIVQLFNTKCPDERRRIKNELKSLVAELKDAKVATLVDYDSRAVAKNAREVSNTSRRASAMLIMKPQPQKMSMGGSMMASRAIGRFKAKR